MHPPPNSAASARPRPRPRPRIPDSARCAGLALLLCTVLGPPCAHAGRTDSDWMAPAQPGLPMDAAGALERLGAGRPAQMPDGGPAAARAARVSALLSEMRIATHEEAQALLRDSALPGRADFGAGTATLSALLDRLGAPTPPSTAVMPRPQGVAGADLDCALFAENVRVRRLLGAHESPKPGDGVEPASAMVLDVPIRCIAQLARMAPAPADRRAGRPVLDQASQATGPPPWPALGSWLNADSAWWMALAGSAVGLAVFGLVARALTQTRARAHPTTRGSARRGQRCH